MRRSAQSRGGLRNVSSDSHVVGSEKNSRVLHAHVHVHVHVMHRWPETAGTGAFGDAMADYAWPSWSLGLADTHPSEGIATLCAAGTEAAVGELTVNVGFMQ